jgi:rfaE bifunctional protein nucleotidyltransferase chain/domain
MSRETRGERGDRREEKRAEYGSPTFEDKLCPPEDVERRIASILRPLVFTNGVFDLLHRGHVTYLAQARALGASLVVALNSDESVRRLGKGTDRPVNSLKDRACVVAALEAASLVTWFDSDTPLELIKRIKPEVLVKGGDWALDDIVGASEVQSWGGAVHSIPFLHDRSTTSLLGTIRRGKR